MFMTKMNHPLSIYFIITISRHKIHELCPSHSQVFYEGISYMNKEQEVKLLAHIRNNDHFDGLER